MTLAQRLINASPDDPLILCLCRSWWLRRLSHLACHTLRLVIEGPNGSVTDSTCSVISWLNVSTLTKGSQVHRSSEVLEGSPVSAAQRPFYHRAIP